MSFSKASIDDAMPLDYTFKKMVSLLDGESEKPREGRVGKTPNRGPNNKFYTKALWLNNNNLASMAGIDKFAESVLENSSALKWIDFSFNNIREIDPVLMKFVNLTILYFHGNVIDNIDQVMQLKELKKMKRLTLHGNPVADTDGYRMIIIHFMPQVQNLDFTPVLKREKMAPAPAGFQKKFSPQGH